MALTSDQPGNFINSRQARKEDRIDPPCDEFVTAIPKRHPAETAHEQPKYGRFKCFNRLFRGRNVRRGIALDFRLGANLALLLQPCNGHATAIRIKRELPPVACGPRTYRRFDCSASCG